MHAGVSPRPRSESSPHESRRRRADPQALSVERGFAVFPVTGIPELRAGDDLAELVAARVELEQNDIVVVAQKAISKIEGRVVRLDDAEPSERAREIAGDEGDARRVEWILREAKRVVRVRAPLVICETRHGFICASAGVDQSNTPQPGTLVLLPLVPAGSPGRLRGRPCPQTGADAGAPVSAPAGHPWRPGTTHVAIGARGSEVWSESCGACESSCRRRRSSAPGCCGPPTCARGCN